MRRGNQPPASTIYPADPHVGRSALLRMTVSIVNFCHSERSETKRGNQPFVFESCGSKTAESTPNGGPPLAKASARAALKRRNQSNRQETIGMDTISWLNDPLSFRASRHF